MLGSSTNQAFPVFQVPYDGEPCMLRLLPLPSCGCRCRTSYFISISWLGMLLSFIHGSIMLHCCLQKRCGTALLQAKCFFNATSHALFAPSALWSALSACFSTCTDWLFPPHMKWKWSNQHDELLWAACCVCRSVVWLSCNPSLQMGSPSWHVA